MDTGLVLLIFAGVALGLWFGGRFAVDLASREFRRRDSRGRLRRTRL